MLPALRTSGTLANGRFLPWKAAIRGAITLNVVVVSEFDIKLVIVDFSGWFHSIYSMLYKPRNFVKIMQVELKRSTKPSKKMMVTLYDPNTHRRPVTIHFGASGYDDYTVHNDDERKRRYIARHSAIRDKNGQLAINNPRKPAFWSLYLLWNRKTIEASMRDIEARFGIAFV